MKFESHTNEVKRDLAKRPSGSWIRKQLASMPSVVFVVYAVVAAFCTWRPFMARD